MNAQASFITDRGNRYLTALCHHFGRKLETGCEQDSGWVNFPFGRCELRAAPGKLDLRLAAETRSELDRLIGIVTSHLERFAFRENPKLEWIHAPEQAAPASKSPPQLQS